MSEIAENPTPSDSAASNSAALTRWLVLAGLTFAVLATGFYWISTAGPANEETEAGTLESTPSALSPEYPSPDFRLASLDGGSVGPPDHDGKVVVIEFWATWCGPCKLQAKMFEKAHEEFAGDGVEFMAINVGEDEETVRRYVEKTPFPYSVLLDPEEQLMGRYQILGLPTVMVVDRDGRVSFMRTGVTDVPTLRREIAKASEA